MVLFLSSVLTIFMFQPGNAQAIGVPRMHQDINNPNIYYFVGMVYFEVWRKADGTWTDGKRPGQSYRVDGFDYTFTFNANRKIKDVKVDKFLFNWEYADETFNASRTGELESNPMEYYKKATSTNYQLKKGSWNGKGTNEAFIPVYVDPGKLEATVRAIDRKKEEEDKDKDKVFAPGVEGWRYFFPTLFTIELEPDEGKTIIQHWTTTGQRLNGVEHFVDREEKLEMNKEYNYVHTDPGSNYTFEGFKKSTVAPPSGGSPSQGDPTGFKYTGTFPVYYLNFYYKPKNDPPPPTRPGTVCTRPEPGRTLEGKYMDPVATGVIKADSRGNESFDVLKGIPTSESLYGNVFSKDYLVQNKFVEMSGTCTYTVVVEQNWTLTWKDGRSVPLPNGGSTTVYDIPRSDPDVRRPSYQVVRPYSYWTIDELSVYNIKQASLMQYAFSGDQITILPSGYRPPEFQAEQTGNYYPADNPSPVPGPSRTKDGGTSRPTMDEENLQSVAEAAIPDIQVENDSLIFKGQTIMDKQRVAKRGPQPVNIPAPGEIGKDVLYSPYNYIPSNKVNKKDQISTGKIEFIMAAGSINTEEEELEYEINGINTVTVHTPVVNYSAVSDDQPHNQKTKPNMSRSALILERPFTVRIPTSGQHLDVAQYPGYGNRDYAKYFRTKQVRFMFDVYNSDRSQFIPANTWIDIPVNQLDTEFYLPVWVDEGDYQVYFRNIAENAPEGYNWQSDANLDLANHAAVDEVSVEVIGRLYDFHITDIADYNWERVFRTFAGSKDPSGASYWVGQNGIDGDPRGNLPQFTLPIRPGSNPLTGMGNVSVKTGYHFKFDFKTKGNMFSKQDGIRITPTFTYVSKAGGTPIPVDLYYKTNEKPFVKIGSAEDTVQRYVVLNERLRNVPLGDMKNSGYWKYDQHLTAVEKVGVDREEFMRNYVLKYTKLKTPVGGYDKLILPEQLKTLIGSKDIPSNASVTPERANASIQQWYGEYSIPAAPYVVPSGTNLAEFGRTNGGLTDKSPIFLIDGYIIVNFDIESIQAGKVNDPHLQYIHAPLMNQWKLEGYQNSILDSFMKRYNVKDGDVVFYNADKSSRDDFSAQAPH
ncbi:hypothetical protein CA599_10925 [Paenibacillus taichungensis]|nr:hypothetical protein CA599_10925 [Paenibacillus taichungensis]